MEYLPNVKWNEIKIQNIDVIKNKPGIYIFSTKQKIDNKYAVNYIGQSVNLQDRIINHFSDSEENKDLKRHIGKGYLMKISYTYIDEEYLDGVELFLYNYYKPTFNKQSPPGDKQISCNLPNVRKYNHY